MGVTIDSIQIEIESSSTNAAKGIDSLAKALEGLKKNGAFKAVSTNLNNLSASLNNLPNVHQASNALRTLANSIEKLKGVGTVASLSNSLKKLPEALKAVSTIDFTRTEAQLEGVARAVSPLSNIKAGGLGTMVNALKNLGDVTKSLDDETIKAFAKKIEQLNEELGPFAEKMSTVKSAFSSINSKARSATSSVKDFGEGVDASALNLSSFIEVARTAVDTIMNLVRTFSEFMHNAMQWDGIEYQFGNAFGEQADMYYEKITKITDALKLNKQMFMENSAMATSMLVGFGVNAEDAREMGLGYTQLAYDIWAAFNNVYESFEGADGAMAAVRSAIAGEVEPIRRAGFTIVESQLEQTAANHGLKISIESATEAQKSYLRYLELVDQAHRKGIVGTYASEMETAEGLVRTLKQQWISLTQSIASLFIPVLVKILPYIQAIVDLLKEGVHWLANLLGIEIQAVDFSDYKKGSAALDNVANSAGTATDALGAATEAAKELKNATLGIDELNVISPSSSSGANGGSGSSGAGDNGFAGLDVGSLWDESIFDTVKSEVDAIKEKIKGWLPLIATVTAAFAGIRLTKLLKDIDAVGKSKLFTGKVKDFTGWFKAFKSLAKEGGIIATLAVAFPKIAKAVTKIGKFFPTLVGNIGAFVALAKEHGVIATFTAQFPKLSKVLTGIGTGIGTALRSIATAIMSHPFVATAVAFVAALVGAIILAIVDYDFTEIGYKFGHAIGSAIKSVVDFGKMIWDRIQVGIDWVVATFGGLSWSEFWAKFFEVGKNCIDGIVDGIKAGWENLKNNIKEFVDGFVKGFKDALGIHSPSTVFADIGKSCIDGLKGALRIDAIKERLSSMWSTAKSWWDSKKSALKTYTPSIGSIYDKLKERWDSAKTWWNEKKSALKSYTPSIGSIYEKVYDRWKNARDWWNSKKGSFKSYTPSIGSITDKIKSAWNSAKSWWSKNAKLSTKLDIKVPKLSVNWGEVSALGKTFKYPKSFSLKFAANGGIFDQGSLIWAGEHGPEVMARAAGGKTGVMNVQQMQDAVYEGVYAAVSAAMRGNGGGGEQAVNVYLDGKQITSAVEKRQRERGASIMGNEVYSY